MFKKILFGLSAIALLASCSKDSYSDWAAPQANKPAQQQTANYAIEADQPATTPMDLSTITTDSVVLFTPKVPEGATIETFSVRLTDTGENKNAQGDPITAKYDEYYIYANAAGKVAVADLQNAAYEMFSKEAIARTFNAVVSVFIKVKAANGTETTVNSKADPFVITVTPVAPTFAEWIYVPGNGQGWNPGNAAALQSPAYDGIYTGYVYLNGDFKFTKARNWDAEYNWNDFNTVPTFLEQGDGTNLNCNNAGVYFLTVNVASGTIEGTKITNMNLVGDFNSWNPADDSQQMTWDNDNVCYTITGATVTASGWKFTANNAWVINLGGSIDDLVPGGADLSVTGTTIKLYPCRTTSEKMYCTVE